MNKNDLRAVTSRVSIKQSEELLDKAVNRAISKVKDQISSEYKREMKESPRFRDFQSAIRSVVEKAVNGLSSLHKARTPILPKNCRFYESVGEGRLTFVIEQNPQIRKIRIATDVMECNKQSVSCGKFGLYSLAMPYTVFVIGVSTSHAPTIVCGQVGIRPQPIQKKDDLIYRFILPNANPEICMGDAYQYSKFTTANNTVDLIDEFIDSFWNSKFSCDYSGRLHELSNSDERFSTLEEWEKASRKNPLFVLEDSVMKDGGNNARNIEEWISYTNKKIAHLRDTSTESVKLSLNADLNGILHNFNEGIYELIRRVTSENEIYPPKDVEFLRSCFDDFVEEATVELRRLYDQQLIGKIEELGRQVKGIPGSVTPPSEFANPW